LLEEIEAQIVGMYPGQTAAEKKAKAALVLDVFKTESWTKVTTLPFAQLEAGLHELKIRRTELEAKAGKEVAP